MKTLTHTEVQALTSDLAQRITERISGPYRLWPVPRGGVSVAYMLLTYLRDAVVVDKPEQANIIVDDIVDSGKTMKQYQAKCPDALFTSLITKANHPMLSGVWFSFPWEESAGGADDIPIRLLQYIGEDPGRGGLQETPSRFLKAWEHWTSGYDKKPESILKVFEDGAEKCDEMVLVKNIPAYSKCEHHLADIFGVAHVAYIPDGKIVGLSKLNRLVDAFGRRLQVQERWTNQVADAIHDNLNPKGVAVVIEARHMCMESRGVCQQGHSTITSAMRGAFLDDVAARAEFMSLIR